MSVRLNAADIREHGLIIIASGETSFDGMWDVLRGGMPDSTLEAIRPYSVFIKNTGHRAVVAFVLKWEMARPDGRVITKTHQYVTIYSLMGDGTADSRGHVIKPNTAWLAFPGFAGTQDGPELNSGGPRFAAYLESVSSDLAQYNSVTVSLDGVFFEDGGFVGPDATGFFSKVEALINANRDLRREIAAGIKSGSSPEDVFGRVTNEANKPRVRTGRNSTADDYYNRFKRSAAEELLQMRSVSGDDKTLEHALRPQKRPWPTLRKE